MMAALDQARAELKRNEALAKEGFVSPNQNETGRLTVRLREQELESARQEESGARHELLDEGPGAHFRITAEGTACR